MTAAGDQRELAAPLAAHHLDENSLATYLAAHIPGFGNDCKIQQFRGGQSNPTYLIATESASYVLRKKPPGDLLPSAHAVDREYRVISALANSAVPVPVTRHMCTDESVIGQMFYVMDYVSGRVFENPAMPGCSAEGRTAAYLDAASVLGLLHAVDYRVAGLDSFGKPDGYVARQVARWSKQYTASKVNDSVAMNQLIEWLPAHTPDDERAAIVHGDFRPGNLILDNDTMKVAAVLDWELSTIGHPLADLGYFLMPYRLDAEHTSNGLRGLDLAALGVPTEQRLIDAYTAAADSGATQNIDYYIVFSMFRLAAILAGVLRRGLDGNASDPAAIERGRAFALFADSAWKIARKL